MFFKFPQFDLLSKHLYYYCERLAMRVILFKAFTDNSETSIGASWVEL